MPSYWGARSILIEQRHREGTGFNSGPRRNSQSQWQQESRNRRDRPSIVGLPEEGYSAPRYYPTKFEVTKFDRCDSARKVLFIVRGDEVLAQVKSWRRIRRKQANFFHDALTETRGGA